ncbi:alpha/beta fold hydrolase [Ideonella sp. 4Y11]|uniref:Alpha/beta fold hydrolase n=1 Tax=Ideonella aquatica TaxID=2824119 RepID=A0A941BIZ0_9BURK|nr:alpha/beta fold hydrolase [Ideonella aquatica]MBQ0959052.1 alpha/beta fold hydrolase [Ideonella aquatica]
MHNHRGPRWLPGGHAQTIWPALWSRHHLGPRPRYTRERWDTPDGDFVDIDFLQTEAPADAPWLVLFHGLEGSSSSAYALAFAEVARQRGWHYAVPHFRGCSGELNRAPRAYHSGDFAEIGWILARLRQRAAAPLRVVGISLGGNALLRWAQESGDSAAATAAAVAAVCSPIDLVAGGLALGRGLNRRVYTPMFLHSMLPKALAKWAQHPGLFDRDRLRAARTLFEFDEVFTGPLHGFKGALDYWTRASAKPHLAAIRIPALVVNALNDPFVPAACLPRAHEVGRCVTLWQPPHGGHVGFASGRFPGHVTAMPQAVSAWLADHA